MQLEPVLVARIMRYRGQLYIRGVTQSVRGTVLPENLSANNAVDHRAIGNFNFRLYRLGWQYQRYQNLSQIQHQLLRVFLYYRLGLMHSAAAVEPNCIQHEPV